MEPVRVNLQNKQNPGWKGGWRLALIVKRTHANLHLVVATHPPRLFIVPKSEERYIQPVEVKEGRMRRHLLDMTRTFYGGSIRQAPKGLKSALK